MEGVGNWLLRTSEFEKWHTGEDQAINPVLFYYGESGVGKTYLRCVAAALLKSRLELTWEWKQSSLVIDTLCDGLDFHAHKELSATSVLAALLKKLVAGVEPIPEEIKMAFDRAKREVDGRAPGLREICAMFAKSVPPLSRGFICIDALDEFPAKHRSELWNSLQNIIRECPNIRLFITGRPHIREEVRKYFPGCLDQPQISPPRRIFENTLL